MVRCCTFLLVVLVQHPQYHGIYMMFLLNTMVFMFGSTQTILQWISVSWFNRYPWIPQNLVTERKPIVSGGQTMWYPDIPHFETNPYMICIQYIHIYIYICYTYLHVAIVAPVSFFWWAMYPGDMQEPACCSYLILVSETSPASLLARRPCLLAIFLFAHPTSLSLFHDLLVLGLYTHVFRYWLPYISYIIVTKIKTAVLALISVSKFRWKITDMKVMSHNTPPYPNLTPPPSKL